MSYTPTGTLTYKPQTKQTSSLFAPLTAGGRDPVRDAYLDLARRQSASDQMSRQEVLLPGMTIRPPWKIGQ